MSRTNGKKRDRTEQGKRWKDSRRVTDPPFVSLETENRLSGGNPTIPEPVHRIPFRASNISVRHIPKVTMDTIREICEFYEQKCAGKYASKDLAARYLFELSREIQEASQDIMETLNLKNERIKYLELCMIEWEEYFGTLRAVPRDEVVDPEIAKRFETPRNVKERLDDQAKEILELKKQLERREEEMKEYSNRLESQIKDHFETTRADAKNEIREMSERNKQMWLEAREKLKAEVQKRRSQFQKEIKKATINDKRKIDILRSELAKTRAENKSLHSEYNKLKMETEKKFCEEVARIRKNIHHETRTKVSALEEELFSTQSISKQNENVLQQKNKQELEILTASYENKLLKANQMVNMLVIENDVLKNRNEELTKLVEAYKYAIENDSPGEKR